MSITKLKALVTCVTAIFSVGAVAQAIDVDYNLRYVGDLLAAQGHSVTNAVNDNNLAVGWLWRSTPSRKRAFYWTVDLDTTLQVELPTPSFENEESNAYAVNKGGTIVGHVKSGALRKAARWFSGPLGYTHDPISEVSSGDSSAYGIAENGWIAGEWNGFSGQGGNRRGFLKTATTLIQLNGPDVNHNTETRAFAIDLVKDGNGNVTGGFVAGTARGVNANSWVAVRWRLNSDGTVAAIHAIAAPGPGNAEGRGVNPRGEVVGFYDATLPESGTLQPLDIGEYRNGSSFYWNGNELNNAQQIVINATGQSGSQARGISDAGRIVGFVYLDSEGGRARPWITELPGGILQNAVVPGSGYEAQQGLALSGAKLRVALGVNDLAETSIADSRIPSIAMSAESVGTDQRHAVVARARLGADGVIGLAIAAIRMKKNFGGGFNEISSGTVINPGDDIQLFMDLTYLNGASRRRDIVAVNTATTATSGSLTFGGASNWQQTVPLGTNESTPTQFIVPRGDAGKTVTLDSTTAGYSRPGTGSFRVSVSELPTQLQMDDATGRLGQPVTLKARLMTSESSPVPIAERLVIFEYTLDNGQSWKTASSAYTDVNGYATTVPQWTIDPRIGVGVNKPILRATYDGSDKKQNGTDHDYPWHQGCVSPIAKLTASSSSLILMPNYDAEPGDRIVIQAMLVQESDRKPIVNQTVEFTVSNPIGQPFFATAITNSIGLAEVVFVLPPNSPLQPNRSIQAVFNGYRDPNTNEILFDATQATSTLIIYAKGTLWDARNWVLGVTESKASVFMYGGSQATLDGTFGEVMVVSDGLEDKESDAAITVRNGFWRTVLWKALFSIRPMF